MVIWLISMSGTVKSTIGRDVYALNIEIREHFPVVERVETSP
jgi:hypothetical protein